MPASPNESASSSPAAATPEAFGARLDPGGGDLRQRTARGTMVNAAFMIGLNSLGLLKGFVVAAFLTTSEYGVWGILVVSIGVLAWLKEVGIGDKYVQQDEPDQERAFQKAFTLEALMNLALVAVILVSLPLFALAYGRWEILAPGLALVAAVPAVAFQTPVWVFYRRMRFLEQRGLQAVDPLVGFVVTVGLAVAGLGYWSLAIGIVCGAWAGAAAAVAFSPYRLAFRYDRGTLREYVTFSWPLLVTGASGVVVAQVSVFAGEAVLGLAGVGVIALASSISLYTDRVDAIVTQTLYPAICAVKDRTDLLLESFVKSNRLALMWGVPFGVGLALFAGDLVEFVIGERWRAAVGLIQAFGLIAAVNHIGFNWTAFYRARSETRPIALLSVVVLVAYLAVAVPLLVLEGLDGFAIGMAAVTVVSLAGRTYYLTRIFPGFQMLLHSARAIAPTLPAAGAVLALRMVETGERSLGLALAELGLYLAITVAATFLLERALLREIAGYLRGRGRLQSPAAA